MPLIRVKHISGLTAHYLSEGEEYYIFYPSKSYDTYFTSAERSSGTYIPSHTVEKALRDGRLVIIRGKEKPSHIKL